MSLLRARQGKRAQVQQQRVKSDQLINHRIIVIKQNYRKTSNIRRTFVGNEIVDHSDVVGASPVGAAPTASSFST